MAAATTGSPAVPGIKLGWFVVVLIIAVLIAPFGVWKAVEVASDLNTITFRIALRPGDALSFQENDDIMANFDGRCHWWEMGRGPGGDIKIISVSPPAVGKGDSVVIEGRVVASGTFVSCRMEDGAFLSGFEFDDPNEAPAPAPPLPPTPTMRP